MTNTDVPSTKQVKLQSAVQHVLVVMSSRELGFGEVHFWMSVHEPKHSHRCHIFATQPYTTTTHTLLRGIPVQN